MLWRQKKESFVVEQMGSVRVGTVLWFAEEVIANSFMVAIAMDHDSLMKGAMWRIITAGTLQLAQVAMYKVYPRLERW